MALRLEIKLDDGNGPCSAGDIAEAVKGTAGYTRCDISSGSITLGGSYSPREIHSIYRRLREIGYEVKGFSLEVRRRKD